MTPDQLNAVTKTVHGQLEEALGPLAATYERLLRGAGRKMARRVRRYSHGEPDVVTAAVHPPNEDEVIPHELADQVDRLTKRERAELVKLLAAAYEAHGIAWDVHGNFTPELLDKIGAHATFATEKELRDIYRGVIQTAAEEGYSIPRTAGAITQAVDGIAGYRATALARTVLIGLVNGASQNAATEAFAGREDVTKVWLATDDERTRETHVEANGQEVPLNEFFDVGGYQLMYPGDPDGPDEEVINCRCTLIYSGDPGAAAAEEIVASATPVAKWAYRSVLSDAYPADMTQNAATAAVTITVEDEQAQPATEQARTPWEGILAIEGHPTSDGRYLLPGEIGNRDLPLPFAASHEKQRETETAGRIETIQRIPASEFQQEGFTLPEDIRPEAVVIWGTGTFSPNERGQQALEELANGVGVSLDLPVDRKALIDATTYEEVDPETAMADMNPLDALMGVVPEGYLMGIGGKIGGVSLASIAAFEETTIRIVGDTAIVASGYAIREAENIELNGQAHVIVNQWDGNGKALTAASMAPLAPPRAWFYREEADEPTPITILPTGEFYGHLALWNTCHAGRANGAYSQCMFAPHSRTDYAHFHLGSMLCDDGEEVSVGRVTIGTGHAPLHLGAAAARAHYDNTGTVVGFARAKDGIFGIWLSGVIKSDATDEQIRDFRACPPSGDWRMEDRGLELQAALAVNVAGYPVKRTQLALAASADSLDISALILAAPDTADFAEALRAEFDLQLGEDIDLLVELGVGEPFAAELSVLGTVDFRDYSAEERRRMARTGEAMPDGSFPIANCTDARNAIQAQGRGSAPQARITSHIRKRVRSLSCTGDIFDPYK